MPEWMACPLYHTRMNLDHSSNSPSTQLCNLFQWPNTLQSFSITMDIYDLCTHVSSYIYWFSRMISEITDYIMQHASLQPTNAYNNLCGTSLLTSIHVLIYFASAHLYSGQQHKAELHWYQDKFKPFFSSTTFAITLWILLHICYLDLIGTS